MGAWPALGRWSVKGEGPGRREGPYLGRGLGRGGAGAETASREPLNYLWSRLPVAPPPSALSSFPSRLQPCSACPLLSPFPSTLFLVIYKGTVLLHGFISLESQDSLEGPTGQGL